MKYKLAKRILLYIAYTLLILGLFITLSAYILDWIGISFNYYKLIVQGMQMEQVGWGLFLLRIFIN